MSDEAAWSLIPRPSRHRMVAQPPGAPASQRPPPGCPPPSVGPRLPALSGMVCLICLVFEITEPIS